MDIFEKIKEAFLKAADCDPEVQKYAGGRIGKGGKYLGWVNPSASITEPALTLDLHTESHLFLLYCLASAWSASGQWENAATLIYTMQHACPEASTPDAWLLDQDAKTLTHTINERVHSRAKIFSPRKNVRIRSDVFPAIRKIALEWPRIKQLMAEAGRSGNWEVFFYQIREIDGLAPGISNAGKQKSLFIKIPLILRELRCQAVYENIPGVLCCVPDARVIDSIAQLKVRYGSNLVSRLTAYRPNSVSALIQSSAGIYHHFGDLYDLPLFSLADIEAST